MLYSIYVWTLYSHLKMIPIDILTLITDSHVKNIVWHTEVVHKYWVSQLAYKWMYIGSCWLGWLFHVSICLYIRSEEVYTGLAEIMLSLKLVFATSRFNTCQMSLGNLHRNLNSIRQTYVNFNPPQCFKCIQICGYTCDKVDWLAR